MNESVFNCKSMIIGHRGAKGDIMENTLESILHAIDIGVDGIEFDVWRCLTGEIIVFHDETVDRLAFKDQFYFGNTAGVKIGNLQWYHLYNTTIIDSLGKNYRIPKLIDILTHPKVYNSDILINIEIKDLKSHEAVAAMISELVDQGLYDPERFMISSFLLDPLIYMEEFRFSEKEKNNKYENLKIGWIFEAGTIGEKDLLISLKSQLKVISHVTLDKKLLNTQLIDKIKEMGLRIFVYTINNPDYNGIENICDTVDGIITDRPKNFL